MAGTLAALAPVFGAGGLGAKLVGGLVSGLGAGLMKKSAYKAEERARIEQEQRLEATYEGVGDAVRFWDQQPNDSASIDPDYQRTDPNSNKNLRVGQREQSQLPGQQYRIAATTSKPRTPAYQYDPQSGQIVPQ